MLWSGRIELELPPKLCDVNSEVLRLVDLIGSPDFIKKLPLGQYLAGVPDQHLQQFVLIGSQVNFLAVQFDQALLDIDLHPPEAEYGFELPDVYRAAQRGANPSQQFA